MELHATLFYSSSQTSDLGSEIVVLKSESLLFENNKYQDLWRQFSRDFMPCVDFSSASHFSVLGS